MNLTGKIPSIIWLDKAEAFVIIKEFYFTCLSHKSHFLIFNCLALMNKAVSQNHPSKNLPEAALGRQFLNSGKDFIDSGNKNSENFAP